MGNDDQQDTIPKPDITDEHREKAKEMQKSYEDDRPTAVLPGTGHTVTGQAVAEWVDDDGNPKFGDEKANVSREDVAGKREETMNESSKPVDKDDD